MYLVPPSICYSELYSRMEEQLTNVHFLFPPPTPTNSTTNEHHDQFGAASVPIYQSATFKGLNGQYDYTRSGNPTRTALGGLNICCFVPPTDVQDLRWEFSDLLMPFHSPPFCFSCHSSVSLALFPPPSLTNRNPNVPSLRLSSYFCRLHRYDRSRRPPPTHHSLSQRHLGRR